MQTVITRVAAAMLLSGISTVPAIATPNQGVSVELLVNGHFGEIDVNAARKTGKWDMMLKTKADSDIGSDSITIAGGGFTGWHSHPAPVFVTVVQGGIVWYNGSAGLCPAQTYSAGQSFIEDAYVIHNAVNASQSQTAKFIAVRINPTGVPFRIDQTQPENCH